jgi:nicotinamidase/pyrazinamidase
MMSSVGIMSGKTALILVDLQNDFCRGGSLAVPDADAIIPLANELQAYFDLVIATKDWHPADHTSFATNHPGYNVGDVITIDNLPQVLWPAHCVQGTTGSDFHPELDASLIETIFYKGMDKNIDSYSAFYDNAHLRATGLADYLHAEDVKAIYIMGLATDYCVKYTCRDAVALGFNTHIIEDACRGVELHNGDIQRALAEMQGEGVKIVQSNSFR